MTNDFCEILYSKLNPEERIFKFKSAEVVGNTLNLSFMVRSDLYDNQLTEHLREKVKNTTKTLIPDDVKFFIEYVKSYTDEKNVKNAIVSYIYNHHKTIYPVFANAKYKLDISGDYAELSISLEKYICDYAKNISLSEKIVEYLDVNFIENFEINFIATANSTNNEVITPVQITKDSTIRVVEVTQTENYYKGTGILDYPRYIKDVTGTEQEQTDVNVCGAVSDVKARNIKLKKPLRNGATEITLFTFNLNDTTGVLKVKHFVRSDVEKWFNILVDGAQLVMNGDLKYDAYDNRIVYQPKAISGAEINYKSINVKSNFNVDSGRYIAVEPEVYEDFTQDDFFNLESEVDKQLAGKTYCVFDLETTGLSTESDEIIEIAAIKIVDGRFTEKFNTFVKPTLEISDRIVELTGITPSMVEDAPPAKDVIHDFYRFSKGSILVGHNIAGFDIPLLNAQAFKHKFDFDNAYVDTLVLARQKLKMGKYKLGAVCEKLNIPLVGAHRAINDVAANAKVFLKLMKM